MSALRISITIVWVVFWIGWLVSAAAAKPGSRTGRGRGRPLAIFVIALGVLLARASGAQNLVVHQPIVQAVGVILFVLGLGLAVWARIHLGRNWGMPMTQKDEPELVTSGPYRLVRHPIYSGILIAALGTALATTLYWLIVSAGLGAYFLYSAKVEERILMTEFPTMYPKYRARTKMLIPFLI